jgi:hypothetical protein
MIPPDWPRMMKRGTAARYLDLTPAELDREVAAGRLPHPVMLGKDEHWSRATLDERLAQLTGEGSGNDWRSSQAAYAGAS